MPGWQPPLRLDFSLHEFGDRTLAIGQDRHRQALDRIQQPTPGDEEAVAAAGDLSFHDHLPGARQTLRLGEGGLQRVLIGDIDRYAFAPVPVQRLDHHWPAQLPCRCQRIGRIGHDLVLGGWQSCPLQQPGAQRLVLRQPRADGRVELGRAAVDPVRLAAPAELEDPATQVNEGNALAMGGPQQRQGGFARRHQPGQPADHVLGLVVAALEAGLAQRLVGDPLAEPERRRQGFAVERQGQLLDQRQPDPRLPLACCGVRPAERKDLRRVEHRDPAGLQQLAREQQGAPQPLQGGFLLR